ncbi:hypothetical protein [Desulforegula conservatrix]|uniref:hypothetical protein n=1 Tax=Desulforegula conservatrix TaxID=153026 RepID=UPI00041366E1|nr:hypothetical protein [Desulforegula conservatrix]
MSSVTIEFWPLLTSIAGVLITFLAFAFAFGKILLSQTDRRLETRFKSMEEIRVEAAKNWEEKFRDVLSQARQEAKGWQDIEREFLKFRAALPLEYVRREDYVRNQTIIEAKLDALVLEIKNLQLKGLREC